MHTATNPYTAAEDLLWSVADQLWPGLLTRNEVRVVPNWDRKKPYDISSNVAFVVTKKLRERAEKDIAPRV